MKLVARETLKSRLPAREKRTGNLNTVVFTSRILNTKVLFGKLCERAAEPSVEGGFY
jgi:hypothetical protein